VNGAGPERLRQALTRLMDAQQEALEAADRALERGGADDRTEYAGRLEEALEDVRDILAGASEDVREILREGQQAG
jgi:adenylosuccinate synthase